MKEKLGANKCNFGMCVLCNQLYLIANIYILCYD